jgi:endonuclease I/methionine-rich copper-binding protein CopC
VNTATTSTSYGLATVDLTAFDAVDGQSNVRLRYTVSGATSSSGNNRIDNLLVSASPMGGGSDTTPPTVVTLNPADNATNVAITVSPSITFSEAVQKGTGNILIVNAATAVTAQTIDVTSGQVNISGSVATITLSPALANTTEYYVTVPAGAFRDLAGNNFAGITTATAWNFTTVSDVVLPMATKTFETEVGVRPTGAVATADFYAEGTGQGVFAVYGVGSFVFSRVDFGLSGASTITGITSAQLTLTHNDRSFSTGNEVEFFITTDVFSGSYAGLSFDTAVINGINPTQFGSAPISVGKFPYTPKAGGVKDTFTLDLSGVSPALIAKLNAGQEFNLIMAATTAGAAVTYSGKGNTFDPGDPELKLTVTETTGTDSIPPAVASLTPADNGINVQSGATLRMVFNELVQKGTGNITIIRTADSAVHETINVGSAQVAVSLATVTITPNNPFAAGTAYHIIVASGAIRDLAGNGFSGISDPTTWNFSTTQPPISNSGPFAVSENALPGTLIAKLNNSVTGVEGLRYAILGGAGGSTMMRGVQGAGALVTPVFTIGDTVANTTGAMNPTSAGSFSPVGVPDGIGAFALNANTVRVLINHELELPTTGSTAYPYTLANGTVISKGGARISYMDIDKTSRRVIDAGLAIGRVYDRAGNVVTSASQLDDGGLDRLCSASLFEPNSFGPGRGLVNRIFFSGEETATGFGHPHGGTMWALDPATGDFWALPDFGRGSWENAALVDTGTTTHVAFLMGDDTQGTPLYMYVGQKNPAQGANFIQRNGLSGGQLYVWKADNGDATPQQFNGTGATRAGTWVPIAARNPALAGTAGYDALGYKNDTVLESEADSLGAFSFSRPEDVATSPTDGTLVAFNSTGRGSLFPADNWGDTYIVDLDFTNLGTANPLTASIRIVYDGDDAGGGQFSTPEAGIRCQDNLDWADDGFIYIQEDQANQVGNFGAAGFEASIWRLNPTTGAVTRLAMMDRSTVLPLGSTDSAPTDIGNWESSGIVDVSNLFGKPAGTLFLFDVQAHSITNGLIASKNLNQGGQICMLEMGVETGTFAMSPNTSALTVANAELLDASAQPIHELRVQAFDGTTSTFSSLTVNVNTNFVARTNQFKTATYNTSLYRDTAGRLITDLGTINNTQAKNIARVIQRNNPDIILVNEFDYDFGRLAMRRFRENYLEVGQSGEAPVYYPYAYVASSNTGIASGFDLDNNGTVDTTPGDNTYAQDAFGFGTFPGQYSFVVFSKFPIDTANIRTFQQFLWKDMPGALLPDNPNIPGPADWYSAAELNVFRLSSKNHADIPVIVNGSPVHILASHPTPPVFDDPAAGQPWIAGVDHNGRRNSDEIRFWSDYVTPSASSYIYDDKEWALAGNTTPAERNGGLAPNSRFIMLGDQNADADEGDSTPPSITTVLSNPLFNGTFVPGGGSGPQPDDTAGFSGGVRVDYVVPSAFGLNVDAGTVFWPPSNDPFAGAVSGTDHYMVILTLTLSGVPTPPNSPLLTYYQTAQGLTGLTLQTALHSVIDDHTVVDYSLVDDFMMVVDESPTDSTHVRLLYTTNTLPKASANLSGGWNREHVWPRSDGVGDSGPDYSDLHSLFPTKDTVNSLRSNLPFDEGTQVLHVDPFAPNSFSDGDSFEPLDRDKGIVARALLYMMTRYDGSDPLTVDLVLSNTPLPGGNDTGILDTLLSWNRQFPPDAYEIARNNAIYSGVQIGAQRVFQGNRNPFIDFYQFADAMLLPAGQTSFLKSQVQNYTLAELLDPTLSGRTLDPDGDGLNAYLEYLLKGNPKSGTDRPVDLVRNGNQVTITFHRPVTPEPLTVTLMSTTSLLEPYQPVSNWQANSVITTVGDYQRIEYTTTINPATETQRYWIVRFE